MEQRNRDEADNLPRRIPLLFRVVHSVSFFIRSSPDLPCLSALTNAAAFSAIELGMRQAPFRRACGLCGHPD
jgi:hypothetical protein